jgi:hypothetical protein
LGDQISPALAHGSGEQILVTYSGWTDTVNGTSYNAMRIWGKFYPFTGIEENTLRSIPYAICLQVYPNPVTKKCNIRYTLPQNMNVHITLYDATGRLVKEIINARQNAGKYQKAINMSNLAQSVYFIRLATDECAETEKVIYLK